MTHSRKIPVKSNTLKTADLHLHTTASDGTLTPQEMVLAAKVTGLSAIAITDHDSVAGLEDAAKAGKEYDMEVIPGIEISTVDGERELHILGYFIDASDIHLNDLIVRFISDRENRAVGMIQKLNELGLGISLDRVREISGTKFIGRPHIARAMLEMGYIRKQSEAFTAEYIGNGGRAYVERIKISPEETISLINNAGGVAVLAHPGYLGDRSTLDEADIKRYIVHGLDGIEVFYSRHTPTQVEYYRKIASKHGILITGGSDSHGKQDSLLGSVRLPYAYVSAMTTYYTRNKSG